MKETYKTICCYCGVGCGITIDKHRDGRLTLEGDKDYPVNKGMLCSKGMNLHYTLMDQSDRLLYPEMRYNRNVDRQRVSWDEALNRTAAVFKTFIKKYGPESIAIYASGQCLTEEYYLLNKLIKGYIGSNNIDTNSRLCMSSAVAAYKMSLGEDIVPLSYDDVELADCIFVAGANPAWCHPILWRRVEAAKAANPGLKIIVSDPRKTQSCALADLHLQINPGTDITLHYAIGRCLIEAGDIDVGFVKDHTDGFEKYSEIVFARSIEESADICGIDVAYIQLAASFIGNAKNYISMWTMGLNQSAVGVQKNLSLINLNLITGQIGKPGAGPMSLTGQPNAMGGREVGGLSNLLAAHRDLHNEAHRREVAAFWGVDNISPKPGLTVTEMIDALEAGTLKAIWILGTNPLHSLPDVRRAEAALKKAKFVVVEEISNKPETLQYADVILPAAGWGEKTGTMTNAERRISLLNKFNEAPGEALPDTEIICRLAKKMGYTGFAFNGPSEIFIEHAALTAGTNIDISGLTYDILREKGSVQWPYHNNGAQQTTKQLFTNKVFYTANGKACIHAGPDINTAPLPNKTFPFILSTGRIRDQWHTRSKTGKVNKLKNHISEPLLEIHKDDAAALKICEHDLVDLQSENGQVRVKASLSASIKKGMVFLPMHWGKIQNNDHARANNLTSALLDPISKEPDFKFTRVAVTRYVKPKQKIVLIGAGAGACGFVNSYRKLNTDDDIEIFSKEALPFYNRVMLPDYISGVQEWKQLIKMSEAEELALNIRLHKGVSITTIDRENKLVTDSNGLVHAYDILLMATGSSAFKIKDVPDLKGIFTMRSRYDADNFKKHLDPRKGRVIIVGGGLLGIEMAASLREMKIEVTIIQRISRLMDRQLDVLGSQLLHEVLTDKGVDIHYNDEVDRFLGNDAFTGIKLKSGTTIFGQSLIMAIGTVPNIDLARKSGLDCKRGVVVNAYLQTSDPSIYAVGEIAEFNGFLYGITAAAEQQAAIVARHISGDHVKFYEGSLLMNILKMHGTDLCSLGLSECPDEPGYEEIIFLDRSRKYYKKCIVHNDKLVGAILIGDKSEFIEFRDLIENKMELSEKRLQLLRSGQKSEPVMGKLVCSCGNIGEGNIRQKIKEGQKEITGLCTASGAGLGCGSCRSEVKTILENELSASLVTIAFQSVASPLGG